MQASLKRKAVCLFSSAGIGELGIRASGIDIVCANEIVPYRASLYKENFPQHDMIEGDIWEKKGEIISLTSQKLGRDELFLVYATPPCQGMSSNGMGRLKWEASQGRRHGDDQRNRLIIPTADVLCALRPRWVLLENVPGMQYTQIEDGSGQRVDIIHYLKARLGEDYVGRAEVIACEDFGIPQKRRRLVTIFTRDPGGVEFFKQNNGSFFSHTMREPLKSLRDAIAHLPPLDGKKGRNERLDFHPYHYVHVLTPQKYWWVENTQEGDTAFNNQCVNRSCLFTGNAKHKDVLTGDKWTSNKETPIYCQKCGDLLPRPVVSDDERSYRLLKGFHSAYRRMRWDEAARTLTQNFIYEASDNKIHPSQNRVLSILEALILQTIDRYNFKFSVNGSDIGRARIAEVIGESVPPYLIEKICKMMIESSHSEN